MENKINIAELLTDCPQGMELYSPIFGEVYLDKIRPHLAIVVTTDKEQGDFKEEFLYDGRYGMNGECMIFPSKDQRDWSKFQRPFKDGDILATDLGSVFYLNTRLNADDRYGCYVGIGGDGSFHICGPFAYKECCGLATEEEKQKLFDAIKANGYEWNAETKTLEKLSVPTFKVWDRIVEKKRNVSGEIIDVQQDKYCVQLDNNDGLYVYFRDQDDWELVPNRFDISTLIPFESRVLVRDCIYDEWKVSFWGCIRHCGDDYKYDTVRGYYKCCIPYENNEHLLGKTDDCADYFKTWEL